VTRPSIKQYQGDAGVCGVDVDLNWYPDFLNIHNTTRPHGPREHHHKRPAL